MQNTEVKAKIAELRQNFDRLRSQCSGIVRISSDTINAYQKEVQELEARL